MQAKRLPKDGTIGIFCPSHVADMERYTQIINAIERLGFNVKMGANVQKDTYGYAASAEERAADLNALVADDSVRMILFSGGQSAVEILPFIDYDNIRRNPKLFSSYSDGTSILNAVYSQTGLVTYYGMGASEFADLQNYDYMQFCSHLVEGYEATQFVSDSKWKTLCGGICDGTLIGGFSFLFIAMLSNKHFNYKNQKYILFLEDLNTNVGTTATSLAFIEQSAFMSNVVGLIFGHFSTNPLPNDFICCLERFGVKHNIPVVYTDDFGHGTRHAILPIGINAKLDADNQSMTFLNINQ